MVFLAGNHFQSSHLHLSTRLAPSTRTLKPTPPILICEFLRQITSATVQRFYNLKKITHQTHYFIIYFPVFSTTLYCNLMLASKLGMETRTVITDTDRNLTHLNFEFLRVPYWLTGHEGISGVTQRGCVCLLTHEVYIWKWVCVTHDN